MTGADLFPPKSAPNADGMDTCPPQRARRTVPSLILAAYSLRVAEDHRQVGRRPWNARGRPLPGGMGGKQLADSVVQRLPNLPVLFTTGYTRNAIIHHGRLDPDANVLTKIRNSESDVGLAVPTRGQRRRAENGSATFSRVILAARGAPEARQYPAPHRLHGHASHDRDVLGERPSARHLSSRRTSPRQDAPS